MYHESNIVILEFLEYIVPVFVCSMLRSRARFIYEGWLTRFKSCDSLRTNSTKKGGNRGIIYVMFQCKNYKPDTNLDLSVSLLEFIHGSKQYHLWMSVDTQDRKMLDNRNKLARSDYQELD